MKAINTRKAIIGIENNKRDAIEKFTQAAKAYSNIEVVALKVQYPQGGEKQLIDALLKRQVPSGALPVSVGAIVQTWVQCSPYTKLFRKQTTNRACCNGDRQKYEKSLQCSFTTGHSGECSY